MHVTPKEATVPANTKVTKNLSLVVFHHIGIPSSAFKKYDYFQLLLIFN